MTLKEKYKFPEGSNVTLRYINPVYGYEDIALPSTADYQFNECKMPFVPLVDTSNVNSMFGMFAYSWCSKNPTNLKYFDTSQVTTMSTMFKAKFGHYLPHLDIIKGWNVSNVTDMSNMFDAQVEITYVDLSQWNTSKVTNMDGMFSGMTQMTGMTTLDCTSVQKDKYPFKSYSANSAITYIGGFLNMKSSWNNNYGLAQLPNLTRESCINILNGLYDFTGHSQTPTSSQGQLKVHSNFITAIGDDISIANNKGWVVSA